MVKEEPIVVEGVVSDILSNGYFTVELENGHSVRGHLSGKMRTAEIKVQTHDKVSLEMTPYDVSVGRIVRRL